MLDRRVTYKRSQSYRTKSNKFRTIKTPGGKLAIQYLKKNTRGTKMAGVKVARPSTYKRLTSARRSVSRPYGGVLTGGDVRTRIVRAFLIEEIKSIKQRVLDPKDKKKKSKKSKAKSSTKK
mmetsp:Transcript_9860/g.7016  ORF Transcript_9860/g.7016 Transcript_9860/m.7016 type:complete len:121 (-) Transcript_9860:236-598(-)